ncbi:MAG: glutathione S-transferase N-terminal domain-containing protein [Steroidobacteraceae bacterium]
MYELHIANKNYSSWSLRAWVLMRELGIDFSEHLLPFGPAAAWEAYRRISPTGKVPCLVDGALCIWDSLSIAEYLAERHPGVWPADSAARAWARSASAEMHSGFAELRNRCSMTCGVRVRLNEFPPALERDLTRLQALWNDGLRRFGGPFLAGDAFTAADAFFAPVALRVQTYGLPLDATCAAYVARVLGLRSMQRWYAEAVQEPYRDEPHEREIGQMGRIEADFRVPLR